MKSFAAARLMGRFARRRVPSSRAPATRWYSEAPKTSSEATPPPSSSSPLPGIPTGATATPRKKRNTALFVGGSVVLSGIAAGYGYRMYSSGSAGELVDGLLEGFTAGPSPTASATARNQEVNDLVGLNANTEDFPKGLIAQVHTNTFAANRPNEDRHAEEYSTSGLYARFGVFDGHGGTGCSSWLKKELFDYHRFAMASLAEKLRETILREVVPSLPHLKSLDEREQFVQALHSMFELTDFTKDLTFSINDQSPAAPVRDGEPLGKPHIVVDPRGIIARILTQTFQEADATFLTWAATVDGKLRSGYSGSCANVVYLLGDLLFVANTGDCRAILGSKDPKTGKWKAIPLSADHATDKNPAEKARLIAEHPDETDIVRDDRIKGMLQPTRAFGDGIYKSNFFNESLQTPLPNWNAPYLTAAPDVHVHKLRDCDSFLVLATDGLYDALENEQVVAAIAGLVEKKGKHYVPRPDVNVSSHLIYNVLDDAGRALTRGGNTSGKSFAAIAHDIDFKHKRMIHDDVTVTVVFFRSEDRVDDSITPIAKMLADCPDSEKVVPPTLMLLAQKKQQAEQQKAG